MTADCRKRMPTSVSKGERTFQRGAALEFRGPSHSRRCSACARSFQSVLLPSRVGVLQPSTTSLVHHRGAAIQGGWRMKDRRPPVLVLGFYWCVLLMDSASERTDRLLDRLVGARRPARQD